MQFQANITSLQQSPQLYRLNQSTAQVASSIKPEQGKKDGKFDTVTISPAGKAVNMMQSLMEQKEALNQRKHELIEHTLESGGNLKDIQEQLESFETSMEAIDEQVAGLMEDTLDVENKAGSQKKEKEDAQHPKTEEEVQAAQLSAVASLAGNLDRVEVAMSTKEKMEGRVRSLRQEIKQDGNARFSHGEKLSASDRKSSEIADLEEKIEGTIDTMGEALSTARETAERQNIAVETPEQDETQPRTESIPQQTQEE